MLNRGFHDEVAMNAVPIRLDPFANDKIKADRDVTFGYRQILDGAHVHRNGSDLLQEDETLMHTVERHNGVRELPFVFLPRTRPVVSGLGYDDLAIGTADG